MKAATVALPLIISLVVPSTIPAGQYYVAPSGNDSNPGTIDQPFSTILKAHSVVSAGDTIYVRGGVYTSSTTLVLSKNGTISAKYLLLAYTGERALLDFSSMPVSSSNRGIRLSGDYWHIKGLDIKGAGDNGMNMSGSYNTVEHCSFFENRDTGLQLGGGAAYNEIINCDSYHNADPGFENADGFAAKLDVGTGNRFYGCRSWQNCDDGFDGYLRGADNINTVIENCWAFKNGYLADGTPTLPNGDGNGFKMGGGDNGNSDSLKHNVIMKNCLAFDNRVKGFDQNNNRGSMTLYNCTGFRSGTNSYSLSGAVAFGQTITITNCAALGATGSIGSHAVQQTNSWMLPSAITAADFSSADTVGVRGPRKPDGSLPDVPFMRIAPGSPLIDAGTDVGIPYFGAAPDLGAFESEPVSSAPVDFIVEQNYPNPFNPTTNLRFTIPQTGNVQVRIFNILGQLVRTLANREFGSGAHIVQWDGTDETGARLNSGSYYAHIQYGAQSRTVKLVLVK